MDIENTITNMQEQIIRKFIHEMNERFPNGWTIGNNMHMQETTTGIICWIEIKYLK